MKKAWIALHFSRLRDQQGVTVVLVALLMFVFLGIAALVIDISNLYVVRNELQNAADAGALAGARFLYNDDGTALNTGANGFAYAAATANKAIAMTGAIAVDVNWDSANDNIGDVQRGHWSFGLGDLARGFYPNNSPDPVNLANVSTEELDVDTNFINAVRVVARRQATPVAAFFARIFGHENFELSAEAVAYIGFCGDINPHDVDQPIAICKDSILQDGNYSCNIGRMINSGQSVDSNETGGWTSFSQDSPCLGGTNSREVTNLICGQGNEETINFGEDVATNGGEIQSAFNALISCWETNSESRTRSWNLTLPVVECPGNNMTTCQRVVGVVNLNIVWITEAGEDPNYLNAPRQMDGWSSDDPDGRVRWASFISEEFGFNLKNVDGSPAPYSKKSIYFKPDCSYHEPEGITGGENFGVLARIPVLVK